MKRRDFLKSTAVVASIAAPVAALSAAPQIDASMRPGACPSNDVAQRFKEATRQHTQSARMRAKALHEYCAKLGVAQPDAYSAPFSTFPLNISIDEALAKLPEPDFLAFTWLRMAMSFPTDKELLAARLTYVTSLMLSPPARIGLIHSPRYLPMRIITPRYTFDMDRARMQDALDRCTAGILAFICNGIANEVNTRVELQSKRPLTVEPIQLHVGSIGVLSDVYAWTNVLETEHVGAQPAANKTKLSNELEEAWRDRDCPATRIEKLYRAYKGG